MSVSPATASVMLGATQQYTATVAGTSNPAVTWSVNGVPGGSSVLGTISSSGFYTAPQILPAQNPVSIQATSLADSSKSATVTVSVASDVAVSLAPGAADVELGATRQFSASVAGSGNPSRAVTWSVTGAGCSGAACGSVDAAGLFTAPQIRPLPPGVTLTAKSAADPSKQAAAAVNITSNFTLVVNGPSSVDTGATAQFTATLTPAPNSNPSSVVNWSVSGPGCSGAACGTIGSTGNYTAPAAPPSPSTVNITATPAADSTRTTSKSAAINAAIAVTVSPASASVELAQTQAFTATGTGTPNPAVTWDVNGIVGGDATVGTVINSVSDPNHTTYTAPVNMPSPGQLTVRARSNANPSVFATAAVTLFSTIAVQLTPGSSMRAINHRQTFSVQVTRTTNQRVQWQVNGTPGGDLTFGRICVVNVDPCQPVSLTDGGSVDYLAPAGVPVSNPVTVSAVSQADPSRRSAASVTILARILVSVLPSSVTLAPRAGQQFTATVDGTLNQSVTWRVSGAGCGGAGSPCGTIDATGFYTAPLAPPSPNTLTATATSAEDPSRSGFANVTIATGANVAGLLPASSTAGAAGGFTLKVLGSSFVASSPGPGSTILFNGSARITLCASSNACTTTLAAADLTAPGNLPVQIRNPDATTSNQVSLVVVPLAATEDVIPLTPGIPSAPNKDIVVVEPSAAGVSSDLNFTLLALGPFSVASQNCVLGGNPVTLVRPASGATIFDVCAFSLSGLDPALNYVITGPVPNDINIIGKQPLGLGIIRLTLQISSTTLKGPRTLLVENTNKDKAAASGALEVK